MILSSTTIPNTRINPERDIKFIVLPVRPRPNTVPSSVTGILTATQKAVLSERKAPRTTNTKARPI